jgi:hypothetical protein
VKLISKIGLVGLAASAAVGGALMFASSASADTVTTPTLDSPSYVNYAQGCTPGVTTHLDYKWVSDMTNAGPTMWTVTNADPNTPATFLWKGVQVPYHRDGIKTQPATDLQCGFRIHTQADAEALASSTTNYANVDVASNAARADGTPVWIQWTHITGTLSVEGKVMLSAVTVNGDVTVSGDGSFLGLSNYASHFAHNLTVQNSSGIYTGGPGTTSFGNWTQYNGPSQVDGNFAFIHNSGGLYSGYPMHVTGNFTYTGNTGPVLDQGGLAVDGVSTVVS